MSDPFLTQWQLPVYLPQARQLVSWVHGMGRRYPYLHRIAKVGDYAYFSDKHVLIRWDVHALDVPDGSWISLDRDQSEANALPDTRTSLADWCNGVQYPAVAPTLFTRAETASAPTSFDAQKLAGVSLMVRPTKDMPIILAPTVGGKKSGRKGWWVMSSDDRVSGLIMPRVFEDEDFNLPKPYEANEDEENK